MLNPYIFCPSSPQQKQKGEEKKAMTFYLNICGTPKYFFYKLATLRVARFISRKKQKILTDTC